MVAKKHRNTAEAANPNAVKRRPSFEIANDFVELNFKPIIEVEAEESLSKAELKAKRKQERRERKQRHLLRNSIIAVICLVVVAGTTATIWWNSSNEPVNALDKNTYQFVVDAIDSLSPKVFLLYHALRRQIPVVSSMGAGAKTDPSQVRIADISKTQNCALAKAVRKRLRTLGVNKGIAAVFSTEMANPDAVIEVDDEQCKRTTTGTISYMPALFGCFLSAHVLRNI